MTPMYAHVIGLDYVSTLFAMISGGIVGFLFFYYLTNLIIIFSPYITPYTRLLIPERIRISWRNYRNRKKQKRLAKPRFTRKNKMLVKIIRNYGLYALVALTPTFLSIPLGAVLLRKYYGTHYVAIIITIIAIILVGIIEISGYWFLWGDL